MNKITNLGAALAIATLLTACGGGGGGSSAISSTSATNESQGLWTGSTSTGRTATGLVLSDGTYYVLYSTVSNANLIAGVVQGTASASGGSLTSTNMRDFNFESGSVTSGILSGSYRTKQSLSGTASYTSGGSGTFTTTYDPDYEKTPTLSAIAGTYSGSVVLSAGVQSTSLTISSSGAISSTSNGCTTSGTVSPRTDGNAYDVTIRFSTYPCYFANQSFSGVAYYNSTTRRLYAATPNSARTDGLLFVGTK